MNNQDFVASLDVKEVLYLCCISDGISSGFMDRPAHGSQTDYTSNTERTILTVIKDIYLSTAGDVNLKD